MPSHERDCHPVRAHQELRREIAHSVAIRMVPEGVEDGEQQQRIFGRFSQRFSLHNQ